MRTLKHEEILECEAFPHPVMLLDTEFNIIYKNSASKSANLKPRMGSNIKKYMDSENIKKLYEASRRNEFKILILCVPSSIKRFVFHPGNESVKAAVFFKTFNYIKEGGVYEDEIVKKMESIMYKYYEKYEKEQQEKTHAGLACGYDACAENGKKTKKVTENFVKHMTDMNPLAIKKDKRYCDIGIFLNNFTSGISQYISSFGYKIACNIEDKMFLYRLDEDDLLLINLMLAATAFKYSVYNKVDIRFFSNFFTGIIRYEFRTSNDFFKTNGGMFLKDYLNDIKDIKYLDMNLAAIVAKNNGLKLNVYFDTGGDNRVCFDLIFDTQKNELESPGSHESANYIAAEKIKEKIETEFAGLFD